MLPYDDYLVERLVARAFSLRTARRGGPDFFNRLLGQWHATTGGRPSRAPGETGSSDHVWIIDPIDGTKNFMTGIPIFGTQIALMKNGDLILSVSNCPALGELVYGEKGAGAFLSGTQVRGSDVSRVADSRISFGGQNYFQRIGREEGMLRPVRSRIATMRPS